MAKNDDMVVIYRNGKKISFPRPEGWVDNYEKKDKKKSKKQEEDEGEKELKESKGDYEDWTEGIVNEQVSDYVKGDDFLETDSGVYIHPDTLEEVGRVDDIIRDLERNDYDIEGDEYVKSFVNDLKNNYDGNTIVRINYDDVNYYGDTSLFKKGNYHVEVPVSKSNEKEVRSNIRGFLSGDTDYSGSKEDLINDVSEYYGVDKNAVSKMYEEEARRNPAERDREYRYSDKSITEKMKSGEYKQLTDKDINDMQIYFGRSNKQDIIKGFNNGEFNKQDIEDAHNFVASEKYRGSPNADQYFKNNVYLTDEEYNDKVKKLREKENNNGETKSKWEEVDSKSVKDSDGFSTEYTLYKDNKGNYKTVFGDKDLYGPNDDGDMDFTNEKEARDWFNDYKGFEEQDDIDKTYLNTAKKDQERSKKFRLRTQTYFGSNDLGEWEGKDFNEARENFFKENPRYKNGDFGMVTGSEVKENNYEFHDHDMNLARQAYKSSMGDKKEFLRKMRQDYNWDNEDAKKYYDKVKNDSPKKGDIYENKNGVKVEITEVDDKRQTAHKFIRKDGTVDYKNYPNDSVKSMLDANGYKKMVKETNEAYKDNKPIIDSNKKTNDYMNDKIRNSANKTRSAKTAKTMGNELRKKNGPVGLTDAKNYMELDGSSFIVNYRDARGYTSGYMSNSGDNGDGISVRSSQIHNLEKHLKDNGYERKNSGSSEYVYIWEKANKRYAKDIKSKTVDQYIEEHNSNERNKVSSKQKSAERAWAIYKLMHPNTKQDKNSFVNDYKKRIFKK